MKNWMLLDQPYAKWRHHPALLGLILSMVLIELILFMADIGWLGSPQWRGLAYQNGAFWVGLLTNWRPNYTGQTVTMFFTYAFLHGGLIHMATNMIVLFSLGLIAIKRVGTVGFFVIYFLASFGGGIAFGVLSNSVQPMIGASGALFGLTGAWVYWDWRERQLLIPIITAILGLILLNIIMWWWANGQLAWQTHLGGFISGWAAAVLLTSLRSALSKPQE
jgi:membrane associated rhomboid family serine protease